MRSQDQQQNTTDIAGMLKSLATADLKHYKPNRKHHNLHESPFAEMCNINGEKIICKKSTMLWFFLKSLKKLSNDRLYRVMQTQCSRISFPCNDVRKVARKNIQLGDWCVFRKSDCHSFLLGRILSFGLLTSNTTTLVREYVLGTDNVGAVCSWFKFETDDYDKTGWLKEVEMATHGLYPCCYYICTMPPPL